MRKADKQSIANEILVQHYWIVQCGGNEEGYIRKYGTTEAPVGGCSGGPAIYRADTEYLKRLVEYGVGLRSNIHAEVSA
jgi:hypothetical protein